MKMNIEESIINDLRNIGANISTLSDYINSDYALSQNETDVLLRWIPEIDDKLLLDKLIRALGETKDSFDGSVLANLFDNLQNFNNESLKWTIANTIAVGKAENLKEWIKSTIYDCKHGGTREPLCHAVIKIYDKEEALTILKDVFDDLKIMSSAAISKIASNKETLDFLVEKQKTLEEEATTNINPLRRNIINSTLSNIKTAINKIHKKLNS